MEQVANPAGLRVLEALVDLIKNAGAVDKILAEIRKARDDANERIAVVGNIEDIEKCSEQAADSLQEARDTLDSAQQKADVILKKAGDQADAEQEKQRRADAIVAAYEAKAAELESREAKVAAREQEVQEDLNQARKIREDFASLFN
jgi:hypothetical protein